MTWQEELRQLDSALAGGELSANEYRKRRDEILAAASSAQPPSPVIGPPTGPRPVVTPESDNGEVTQIVNTAEAEQQADEADSTQIISDPAAVAATVPAEPAAESAEQAADRTQVIAADERTAPSVPQGQTPWAATRPDPNAPTGVFPRPAQPMLPPPAVTPMDAQDLFTSNKPPRGSRKGKPWLIGLAVLLVLALAGAGVWWFVLRDDNTTNTADPKQTSEQQQPPSEDQPPTPVDIADIDLPGDAVKNGGEMDIVKASELKVIAPAEAALLKDAGVGPMVYAGSAEEGYRYLLYSYQSDDADGAKKLTEAVAGVQENIGLKPAEVDGVPGEVAVTKLSNSSASVMRGLYTYGDTTIQLCVLQVPAGAEADLASKFAAALKAVTDAAPPAK